MATVNPPLSHADVNAAGLGFTHTFAGARLERGLHDAFNAIGFGLVRMQGDIAGSKSDTVRVTYIDGVGYDLPFAELSGETDVVAASPVDFGYTDITVGMYGLSHAQTYMNMLTGVNHGMNLEGLMALIPESYSRTIRDLACTVGAGFSTAVGSATSVLTVNDWLDLATEYRVTDGAQLPKVALDPQQFDELVRSFRNEPAFQNAASVFGAIVGLQAGPMDKIVRQHANFAGMGMDIGETSSVVQSGGAYQGFAAPTGGIGMATGNTAAIRPANPQGATYAPRWGILTEELTAGAERTERQYRATAFVGLAAGSDAVWVNRRVISTT